MDLRVEILVLALAHVVSGEDIVNTTSGLVRGQWMASMSVSQFLGIPYAEAPEGELRFKPPVRKARMEGIYNATSNTKVCPQHAIFLSHASLIPTEDCLRLDVYVPSKQRIVAENTNLPVMIWVHGGGYLTGSSAKNGGPEMASIGQVIVVTINYRLGLFGFFNTMDKNSVGNLGLRDQCSAIEWVVDNIGKFGGDVTRVTIFGASSGASSVMQLAMSSLCKGKFQRVIAESGNPSDPWSYNADPKKSSLKLARASGCPSESSGLLKCLRNMTMEKLLSFQLDPWKFAENDWAPSYTTDIFPDHPVEILRGINSAGLRRFQALDFLAGICKNECELCLFWDRYSLENYTRLSTIEDEHGVFGDSMFKEKVYGIVPAYKRIDSYEMDRLYPAIKFQYTDWNKQPDEFSNVRSLNQLYGDIAFNIGIIAFANLHSSGTTGTTDSSDRGRTYFYQFKPKPSFQASYPWSQGAAHSDDVYFVFGTVGKFNGAPAEVLLSERTIEYWTNFAKTGSPNEPGLTRAEPLWPMYNRETGAYIQLDLDLNNDSISAFPLARRSAFWEEFYKPELKRIRDNRKQTEKTTKCDNQNGGNDTNSARLTLPSLLVKPFLVITLYMLASKP